MTSKHTRAPWSVDESDPYVIHLNDDEMVGVDMYEEDVAHIVHCVNNHDKLTTALEDIINTYAIKDSVEMDEAMLGAEKLLAKVKSNEE